VAHEGEFVLASRVAVQVSRADFNEPAARLFCTGPLSAKLSFNIVRSQPAATHGGMAIPQFGTVYTVSIARG
jgi:hypothetical protein